MYTLVDFRTQKLVTPTDFVFTGKDGPWEVAMDLNETRASINEDYFRSSPPFVSKYLPFLPVRDHSRFVSLKEGGTPLIRSRQLGDKLGIDLWFKLETQNPTGSFKDRGSAVDLTVAREIGAKAIVLASTGNMAASCACYAAAAGMPCFVFVPDGTPSSKLAQVIAFGGHIVQVKGEYNDCAALAEKAARELNFYLAGDYAFRVEGQKTAALEICDQLFFHSPDAVIVPVGCGTNIAGYAKGFREYKALGYIDESPRLFAVQAAATNAVVIAFEKQQKDVSPFTASSTIASAIGIGNPIDGVKALAAVYDTNGGAVDVTDKEMLRAQHRLSAEEGLFVEVSSASAIAAMEKLVARGELHGKRVVCVLTGHGLKDPSPVLKVALKPPTIAPEVSEFLRLYERSFFTGTNVSFFEPSNVIFTKEPSAQEIKDAVERHFSAHYSDHHIEVARKAIVRFLKKGKAITFADFQDVIQDALRAGETMQVEPLAVEDFEIQTRKDKKPSAWVLVRINGEMKESSATGVGPVDAALAALRHAAQADSAPCELLDYFVGIRDRGADAVTEVELKLARNGAVAVGTGVSPDVIQASIEAFVRAYNDLWRLTAAKTG